MYNKVSKVKPASKFYSMGYIQQLPLVEVILKKLLNISLFASHNKQIFKHKKHLIQMIKI